MTLVGAPTVTDTINQDFFIEALGGSQNPISYLDTFPDAVYTKAVDSLLVKFMYALLGPVGVGNLREEYLEARLQIEQAGLSTSDIDSLYTNAFAFARLAEETYNIDASADLLPASQRAEVLAQDASFRNRAIDFLKGARGGGTLRGLTLVARSGLNRPVELVENYRAMWDRYTDVPLGLPYLGSTQSTNEVIVLPRQIAPQSALQTLTLSGSPVAGYFTITYPTAQSWMAVPVTTSAGVSTIQVPNTGLFPSGVFVTLTNLPSGSTNLNPGAPGWNNATLYTQSQGPTSTAGQIQLASPAPSTGTFIALVGVAQTTPIPFNATAGVIQNALVALPVIGNGGIICTGGPLPINPIQIQFAGNLSDRDVPYLLPNLEPDKATGIGAAGGSSATTQMTDITGSPLNIAAVVTMDTVGASADGQTTTIAPADQYAMETALNQTRPLTTVFTTQPAPSGTVRQAANATQTQSTQAEVLRYVTGRTGVSWPSVDSSHWIESGVEHEAPTLLNTTTQHYQNFHNISSMVAYTEGALADGGYDSGTTNLTNYWDTLVGNFSADQLALVPGLRTINQSIQHLPAYALADPAEPLILKPASTPMVNGSYAIDYLSLPVFQSVSIPTGGVWASSQRTQGVDYLEVDLGSVQAVNYLYFEATSKPYLIDVAYDTLDQVPARRFIPVTLASSQTFPSVTSLTYANAVTNMWETVRILFGNRFGGMIYTRFLRIGFTRSPSGTPFAPIGQSTTPYSIEVRNLRLGRNIVPSDRGETTFASSAT